jgi:hypothetical protein
MNDWTSGGEEEAGFVDWEWFFEVSLEDLRGSSVSCWEFWDWEKNNWICNKIQAAELQ